MGFTWISFVLCIDLLIALIFLELRPLIFHVWRKAPSRCSSLFSYQVKINTPILVEARFKLFKAWLVKLIRMLSITGYRMEPALADLNTQFARYAKSWCSAHANWITKRFLNFYRFGYCQSRSPSTGRTVEAWTQNGGRWRQILSFSLISRSLVLVVGQNVEYNSSLRFGELVKTFSEQRKPFGLSQKIVMFSLISEWLSGNWSWYIWGEEKGSCITKGIKGGGESSPGRGKVEGDFSSIRCVKTVFFSNGESL